MLKIFKKKDQLCLYILLVEPYVVTFLEDDNERMKRERELKNWNWNGRVERKIELSDRDIIQRSLQKLLYDDWKLSHGMKHCKTQRERGIKNVDAIELQVEKLKSFDGQSQCALLETTSKHETDL